MRNPVQEEFKSLVEPKITCAEVEKSWSIIVFVFSDNICIIHQMKEISPMQFEITFQLKIIISLHNPKIYLETVQLHVCLISFYIFMIFLITFLFPFRSLIYNVTQIY